jgi:hypothetical protein
MRTELQDMRTPHIAARRNPMNRVLLPGARAGQASGPPARPCRCGGLGSRCSVRTGPRGQHGCVGDRQFVDAWQLRVDSMTAVAPMPMRLGLAVPGLAGPTSPAQRIRALQRSQAAFPAAVGAHTPGLHAPSLGHPSAIILVMPALTGPSAAGALPMQQARPAGHRVVRPPCSNRTTPLHSRLHPCSR